MKNFFTNIWVHIVFVFVLGFFIFGRLNGFCAGSLSIAPSAVPTFEAFSQGMASGGFAWGDPVVMTTEALNNINMNLYQLYGYDLNDLVNDSWTSLTTPSEWSNRLTQFVTGNATIDGNTLSTSVADQIAQRISQGALTGAVTAKNLLDSGYAYFSTAVPQWGENAKQFFIGKRDALTNEIVDVSPTMVTKITSQGLAAYNQVYNNLLDSHTFVKPSVNKPIFSHCFSMIIDTSADNGYYSERGYKFTSSIPMILCSTLSSSVSTLQSTYACIEAQYYDNETNRILSDITGTFYYRLSNGSVIPIQVDHLVIQGQRFVTVNGIEYVYGSLKYYNPSWGGYRGFPNAYSLGTFNDVLDILNNSGTASNGIAYDYSSSALSQALKDQLDRLLDKYVDSITLGRINDIVQSIPIGQELVGEADVPVAIPTQEVVDELTGVIDDALELDEAYALAFDDAYAEPIDTSADPSPDFPKFPSGVPEEYVPPFLIDLFPTDMFSMFEPIFDIVGDQYSMFDTWLLIPAIFIFLFIFYVIISVL